MIWTPETITHLAKQTNKLAPGLGVEMFAGWDECWAPYLRFLFLCADHMRNYAAGGIILETGTFQGTSAAHLALGYPTQPVLSIDIAPQPKACEFQRRLPNLVLYSGMSIDFHPHAKWFVETFGPIGLLFLDTLHDGVTPQAEWELYKDLVADECLIVVDDLLGPAHLQEQMAFFWTALPGEKMELHDLHPQRIGPNIAYHDAPGFGVSIFRRGA